MFFLFIILFFAFVGIGETASLILSLFFKKSAHKGYYLLPRCEEESLEYELRFAKAKGIPVILLNNCVSDEAKEIVRRFPPLRVAARDELPALLEEMDERWKKITLQQKAP